MERIFKSTSYAGLGLLLTFALWPGMSMLSVKASETVNIIATILYFSIMIATVVSICLTLSNKMPPAPKWFVTTVFIILLPYISALSTAIDSIREGEGDGNYWVPIGEVILILITAFYLWRKERRQAFNNMK